MITGGSGSLGRRVLQRLAERQEEARGLIRPPKIQRLREELRGDIELLPGDYAREESLRAALAGVDYVITAARASLYDRPSAHYKLEVEGNRRLFRFAREAGVKHLSFISLLHAGDFPENHIFNAKHQAEAVLRESGLNYTIFRPSALMSKAMLQRTLQGLSKGWFTPVEGEKAAHSPMMYEDLAEFCIRAFALPGTWNSTFDLGGPVVYRGSEWARDLANAFGVTYRSRAESSFLTSLMLRLVQPESRNARGYMAIKTLRDFSVEPAQMEKLALLFGVKLHRFEDFYSSFQL